MEKFFKLKENGTNVKSEIIAGITTFMTMAYILAVNPSILSATGMDKGAVFTATVVSSIVATLIMGLLANLPFALAPGMGLNAFFAYTVVLGMGYSWQTALTAVFIEGIIFLVLTIFNVREAIVNSIPLNMKRAISVGIGLFIAFIGLQNSKIIVNNDATLISLGDITSGSPLLAIIGLLITSLLLAYNVKGAILIGILLTTLIGIPMGITQLSPYASFAPPSLEPVAFKLDFANILHPNMFIVLFTFLFVDMFDTVGTLVGVCTKANMLTKGGEVPRCKQALFADAVGTIFGACMGTSTVTTYVESASGVAEGGKTGLTAVVVAILFTISLFLSHIFLSIPSAATAPALIIVGLFMMTPILEIDLTDYTEAIPSFVCIIFMPFAYSIAEGITFGILAFTLLKLLTGRTKEITLFTWILAALLVIKILMPVISRFLA
ncbi:NCS2 family permease [Brachyspira pilosicoli]|uniref:Integral membrane transport protein n=1 Tax=Brachyspira pilosicoli (strain ATCC BAA-1826 / 95/1000) TaxID=759914 RepID=D8IDN4_BRAP9|nr:NCS2 family permease [Brachyspira pilosicoli]ADK31257.1 integral membrane transport protein [Brachyspira pilosicoli 95/1000]MBW5378857.1 NCS2 family permease [Brachyspira pilosicoli]MBW5382741.1 NCS2 family permease [Brachyspira pilosicoli]WIH87443.1 NCS2 family permease [Brachyspira pilosicoli]SUW00832.1 integral membrane transport protein [Brachyspira pilosicoli]